MLIFTEVVLFLPPSLSRQICSRSSDGLAHTSRLEMASSSSTSTQPTIQELLVLYLTRLTGQRWRFRALPISRIHLDSTPASVPSPIDISENPSDWDRFCELLDILSRLLAPNSEFEGWWVHMSLSLLGGRFRKIWHVFLFLYLLPIIGKSICWKSQ